MTNAKVHLRIPGPTPCPEEVLEAMTAQMINHRGPAFKEILGARHRPAPGVLPDGERPLRYD